MAAQQSRSPFLLSSAGRAIWLSAMITVYAPVLPAQGASARVGSGVRTVDNPARRESPIAFTLAPTPSHDLGGLKSNPEDEFTANGGYLVGVGLSDGRHAVIDETRIRFFSARGKQVGVTGRKGNGPGEFQQITSICRTRGDTLVVNDPANGRVTVLNATGRVVRSIAVGHVDLPWGGGCFDDGTFVLVTNAPSVGGDSFMRLVRRRLDGSIINTIGPLWLSTFDRFLPSFATVVAQGTKLFVSDTRVSEVYVYTASGVLTTVIRTADPIEKLTAAEQRALTPTFFSRPTNSAASKAILAEQNRLAKKPSRWPSYASIAVDPAGRLWVTSFRKSGTEPYTYTGFSPSGKMLGRFVLPAATPAVAFTADGVMLHRQDNDGAEHLVTYKLLARR
ncbi:MAG: hypothetical protein ABIR59_13095 [Gemmatimonadales bacterium]